MRASAAPRGPAVSPKLYELVTQKIVDSLKEGVVPWRKPWRARRSLPCNAVTSKPYRGVNLLLLGLTPYEDHRWLTFRQATELGGKVRKGEKSAMVVFWKHWQKEKEVEGSDKPKRTSIPVLKYHSVFNAEQCEGLALAPILGAGSVSDEDRIRGAEALICSMPNPPFIEERGDQAFYLPTEDIVRIPKISRFDTVDQYYATTFHELGHSTGHKKRLNRKGVMGRIHFGSEDYGREELVAELTSSFCCASVGLDNTLPASASYIDSWLKSLERDPKAVVVAAAQAQKAADYIRGLEYSE
ncbi:MAG: DUF1738 domain-containing protein [Armatimonadetes bacterium]|nr:DUF1738 domain-containing protein [Armatimonadota bacterium]